MGYLILNINEKRFSNTTSLNNLILISTPRGISYFPIVSCLSYVVKTLSVEIKFRKKLKEEVYNQENL